MGFRGESSVAMRAGVGAGLLAGAMSGGCAAVIVATAPGVLRPEGASSLFLPALQIVALTVLGAAGGVAVAVLLAVAAAIGFARRPWPLALGLTTATLLWLPVAVFVNVHHLPALGSAVSLLGNAALAIVLVVVVATLVRLWASMLGDRSPPSTTMLAVAVAALAVMAAGFVLVRGPELASPPAWADIVSPPPPETVILITIDTLRADHVGAYGYELATTPTIDRLAAEGVVFEQVIAQAPSTHPSMASMLTGAPLQAFDHTAVRDFVAAGTDTLALEMKRRGYHTAAVVSNPFLKREMGFAQGFDRFEDEAAMVAPAARVTDVALAMIAELPSPRFLWVHYIDPHHPYNPPAPFDTLFGPANEEVDALQRRPDLTEVLVAAARGEDDDLSAEVWTRLEQLYDGEIRYTDREVGRLLDGCRNAGLLASARVVLTADHGEEFRDHGGVLHSHTLYRELVRLPLILWSTGPARSGRVSTLTPALAAGALVIGDVPPPESFVLSEKMESARGLGAALVAVRSPTHTLIATSYRPGPAQLAPRRWARALRDLILFAPVAFRTELYANEDEAERNELGSTQDAVRASLTRELRARFRTRGIRRSSGSLPSDETLEQLRGLGYLPGTATRGKDDVEP